MCGGNDVQQHAWMTILEFPSQPGHVSRSPSFQHGFAELSVAWKPPLQLAHRMQGNSGSLKVSSFVEPSAECIQLQARHWKVLMYDLASRTCNRTRFGDRSLRGPFFPMLAAVRNWTHHERFRSRKMQLFFLLASRGVCMISIGRRAEATPGQSPNWHVAFISHFITTYLGTRDDKKGCIMSAMWQNGNHSTA